MFLEYVTIPFKQLKAHNAEVEKLKEYFDEKMTQTERTNYDFLQDSPKTIINSLSNDLLGKFK